MFSPTWLKDPWTSVKCIEYKKHKVTDIQRLRDVGLVDLSSWYYVSLYIILISYTKSTDIKAAHGMYS